MGTGIVAGVVIGAVIFGTERGRSALALTARVGAVGAVLALAGFGAFALLR